jgi:DNA-binding transcriptional ArsR family regulator
MAQMALPHPLPAEYARTVADRFRLLGDPTRLLLMDQLRDGERCVGALAETLGCTQANVSKHLSLLADGGLVVRRRQGLNIFYAVSGEDVFELCDAVCASVLSHLDARTSALRATSAT